MKEVLSRVMEDSAVNPATHHGTAHVQENVDSHQSNDKRKNGGMSFEKDIKMTPCEYLERYQMSDKEREEFIAKYGGSECVEAQDVQYLENKKWKNNIVPFKFDSKLDEASCELILKAIKRWSEETCLTFIERTSEKDYIHFHGDDDGCWSLLGRYGGEQTINLAPNGCMYYSTVLHEIGHALGLDHEQSRPDRDLYITINTDNIIPADVNQFDILKPSVVDFQGSEYDYGSIMQYGKTYFSKPGCTGEACTTMQVNNEVAYERQGRPKLGKPECLRPSDILQINRAYHCPSEGKEGLLMLRIAKGVMLPTNTPSVQIKALDSNGKEYEVTTSKYLKTNNPTWNEFVFFPYSDWQLFRLSVWDSTKNKRKSLSQTIPLYGSPKSAVDKKHCCNVACSQYVTYDYDLVQVREGALRVTVIKAQNIPSDDGIPNPYITVSAVSEAGQVTNKKTAVVEGKTNPVWNEMINFDECTSAGFYVQVWDHSKSGEDAPLSLPEFVELSSDSDTKKICFSEPCNFFLSVSFQILHPRECARFEKGRLTITIKYGRYLTTNDYNLYPYVSIDAHTHDGKVFQKTSKIQFVSRHPQWNENIDFGVENWKEFKVALWDYWDENKSIPWSKDQTYALPLMKGVSTTNARLYAYYGYVDFNYKYT